MVKPLEPLVGQSLRQRGLFPLPPLGSLYLHGARRVSRPVKRRVGRSSHTRGWANDGIKALNELGGRSSSAPLDASHSEVTGLVLDHISAAYESAGPPPDEESDEGAFQQLLTSAGSYHHDRADIASYDRDKVSWPQPTQEPVGLAHKLEGADGELLRSWKRSLLRSREEADALTKE